MFFLFLTLFKKSSVFLTISRFCFCKTLFMFIKLPFCFFFYHFFCFSRGLLFLLTHRVALGFICF